MPAKIAKATTKKSVATKTKATESKVVKSVPAYTLAGVSSGSLVLPKEIFFGKVNTGLMSQMLRVYLNNQKGHFGNTKTRGEVAGSTAKMGNQKGSGRARHGTKRAPIFVHGGIAMGPKFRKVTLELPKKMKKAALISVLSERTSRNEVLGLTGLEKATGKTKQLAGLLNKLSKDNVLFVVEDQNSSAAKAVRNLPKVSLTSADQLNPLEVIRHRSLILTKEAVSKLESRLLKSGEK